MMWIWIIIAVIVIAGLLFWVKSGSKNGEADSSADVEVPEEPTETPEVSEPSVEEPKVPEVSEAPEEPVVEAPVEEEVAQEEEVTSEDEEDKMV